MSWFLGFAWNHVFGGEGKAMTTWTADDGTEINFEVYGERSSDDMLLLLPGLLGSLSSQWRGFIRPLSADFRVILMDLRGHGRSANQESMLTPERMMQDLIGLLEHLKVNQINIAGYDFGGYLGLMLALNEPHLVSSLLMHGTKFYWTSETSAIMRQQLDPDRMAAKVPTYADQLVQEHGGRHWRVLVRQAADLVSMLAEKGLNENVLASARCPVLVSLGDRDEMVPLLEAQRLSRLLPKGQLIVLPGVGHSFQTIRPVPLLPMMQYFIKNSNS
jgi:pimeloyl-ACP methyl ester carboxylesterase